MYILGLTGIQAAIAITVLGMALVNIIGWLKSPDGFNPRQVAATALFGFIITIQAVIVEVDVLEGVELTELQQFAFIAGMIGQVMGFDYGAKAGLNAALGRKDPNKMLISELRAAHSSGDVARASTGSFLDGILRFLQDQLDASKKELETAKSRNESAPQIKAIENEIRQTQKQIDVWTAYAKSVRSRTTWWR